LADAEQRHQRGSRGAGEPLQFGGECSDLAGQGLVAPGGIAISDGGSIYVTNFSVSPGAGTVVRIVP